MKKILSSILILLAIAGFAVQAQEKAPAPAKEAKADAPAEAAKPISNPTVDKIDQGIRDLTAKVYPAFVLIGGGSGVVISEDGYFLTNHHVWSAAAAPDTMSVKMAGNGFQFTADSVGADPRGDIVLGKLRLKEGQTVPFCALGDSDKVRVGDICLSVGNPFLLSGVGSEPTVTLGTVTAVHRFQGGYNDCIQVDTAINPGNSGGPSFNLDGEVIGINGRMFSNHLRRYNTGAGYAIPSTQIKNFMKALKAQAGGAHVVRHGLVGGLEFDLNDMKFGARIKSVKEESEAGDAGFKVGDRIIRMDKHKVGNAFRYYGVIGTKPRGSAFSFVVQRANETINLTARNDVPVESSQDSQVSVLPRPDHVARKSGRGMNPFPLPNPKSTIGFRGKPNEDRKVGGYLIRGFARDANDKTSALKEAGLQVGDILTHLNDRHIVYICDLTDILIAVKSGSIATVKFIRAGEEMEATIVTGKAKKPRRRR